MQDSVQQRVVAITGAGRGIGRALALGFADAGYRVAVSDLDASLAEETATLVRSQGGAGLGSGVDVTDPASVSQFIDRVSQEWGGLDAMINNAGVFPRSAVLDLDLETWNRTLDTNLRGTFLGSQAAARVLVAQGRGGRIVNVASASAFEPHLRQAHYAASKAGIVAFSHNLALELAPHRITVNALAPGLTNTRQPRQDPDVSEAQLVAQAATIPLGRWAEPADLVPMVLFLCSDGARHMTGQTLHVNGGSWMS